MMTDKKLEMMVEPMRSCCLSLVRDMFSGQHMMSLNRRREFVTLDGRAFWAAQNAIFSLVAQVKKLKDDVHEEIAAGGKSCVLPEDLSAVETDLKALLHYLQNKSDAREPQPEQELILEESEEEDEAGSDAL
jgi:hypothetical protein